MTSPHSEEAPHRSQSPAETLRKLEADVQAVLPGIAAVSFRLLLQLAKSVAFFLAWGLGAGFLAHFVGASAGWSLFWGVWAGGSSLVFAWDDISTPLELFRHNRSIAHALSSLGREAEACRVATPFGVRPDQASDLCSRFALLLSEIRGA
jgi:hypothetical protein